MKISIIIATYNAASTLKNCLESIVPQMNGECELIIIDGGSADETNDIITSFANDITYTVSEKDKGIYDAWNKGVKVAKGEWIAFIGADDELLPGAINHYLTELSHTPRIDTYDYICAHNEFVDMTGKLLKISGANPIWEKMRKGMVAAHVASLHNKKNLFETIGDYDYERFHICADYELLLRKGNSLKSLFIDARIAKMKVGGISFSFNAIKETYHIRKIHHSVSVFYNIILFMRDSLAFIWFRQRKRLMGGKL